MIEAISTVTASEPKRAAKAQDDAPPFSYALAAASLEAQAGASLKAHGGAPTSAAETARPEPRAEKAQPVGVRAAASAPEQTAAQTQSAGAQSADANVQSQAQPPAHPGESQGPERAQNPVPPFAGMSGATSSAAAVNAQGAAKPSAQVEIAARDVGARAQEALKTARAHTTKSAQPAQDFARLLAKKLDDGATAFHLRLDPPELGRVEARLTMGEDGKAALALAFDNQAALDLFSKDEAQLRAALLSAGFDASGADISFSLNERSAKAEQDSATASAPRLPIASEHSFLAPVATGVIDVSV